MANWNTTTSERFTKRLAAYKAKNPNVSDTVARKRLAQERTKK